MSNYAVIGNPVQHSKSPLIHTMFAKQTGQQMSYAAVKVEADGLEAFVHDFFANGGGGLNVTLPYKEKVFAMVDSCSERAALAKAVNTLFLDREKQLSGDNTDGVGLVRDIQINHQFPIKGKRVLFLGAGGAVRGALASILLEQPSEVFIVNRTQSKAEQLQRDFSTLASIQVATIDQVQAHRFDLIINGTSMGLNDAMPALSSKVLSPACCCYDMMYKQGDTAFVAWAKQHHAELALDGLGMLVEQAAEAFALWRGVRPATAPVITQLRS